MTLSVKPAKTIRGHYQVPPAAELAQRAAVLSLLTTGTSTINNWPTNQSTSAVLKCITQLGATVTIDGSVVQITGIDISASSPTETDLDGTNTKSAFWLLLGLLSGLPFNSSLHGDNQTMQRLTRIGEILQRRGAQINVVEDDKYSTVSFTPAQLTGGSLKIDSILPDAKLSSMMAALFARAPTEITEELSLPDDLERILPAYGVKLQSSGPPRPPSRRELLLNLQASTAEPEKFHKRLTITPHPQPLQPVDWMLPGDFSLAAPLLTAAVMTAKTKIQLTDVALNPTRIGLLKILKRMGANLEVNRRRVENGEPVGDIVVRGGVLKGTKVTRSEVPSLLLELPLLAVAAGAATGVTVIRGLEELVETGLLDLEKITNSLRRLGVKVAELEDGWAIEGPTEWHAAKLDAEEDEMMGMAFAIAGLFAEKEMMIINTDCVAARYPDFQKILLSFT